MSAWLLEYGHAGRYSYGNSLVIRTNNSPVVPDPESHLFRSICQQHTAWHHLSPLRENNKLMRYTQVLMYYTIITWVIMYLESTTFPIRSYCSLLPSMKGRSTGGTFEKSRNRRDHSIALDISLRHSQGNGRSVRRCGNEEKEVGSKALVIWGLSCGFVIGNEVGWEEEATFPGIAVNIICENMQ